MPVTSGAPHLLPARSASGVDLPATAVFDYPSIKALAAWLAPHLPSPDTGAAEPEVAAEEPSSQPASRRQALQPARRAAPRAAAPRAVPQPAGASAEQQLEAATALVSRGHIGAALSHAERGARMWRCANASRVCLPERLLVSPPPAAGFGGCGQGAGRRGGGNLGAAHVCWPGQPRGRGAAQGAEQVGGCGFQRSGALAARCPLSVGSDRGAELPCPPSCPQRLRRGPARHRCVRLPIHRGAGRLAGAAPACLRGLRGRVGGSRGGAVGPPLQL